MPYKTEIFGPVLGFMPVDTIEGTIEFVNTGSFVNI
jgi:acyl-CoA reductase-like NAD-dependent aldehyde dehydrogenase